MPILADSAITKSSEIMDHIRLDSMNGIKEKYQEIIKNMTPHYLTTGFDFDCRTSNIKENLQGNSSFHSLQVENFVNQLSNNVVQTISNIYHKDCKGKLIFVERIEVHGKLPELLALEDLPKFNRMFEIQPGEIFRSYRLEDQTGQVVFNTESSFHTRNMQDQISNRLFFFDKLFIELDQFDPSGSERRLEATVFPIAFNYLGFSWKSPTTKNLSIKMVWDPGQIEHFIDNGIGSQASFDAKVDQALVTPTAIALRGLFARFIEQMPKTQKVDSGVTETAFYRDLKLNFQRVLNRVELDKVRDFLNKTLEDIKAGRLKIE